jgi:hypothetical protein
LSATEVGAISAVGAKGDITLPIRLDQSGILHLRNDLAVCEAGQVL